MLAVVTEPQVFIECEKCRDEGRDSGQWFPARTAGAVRSKDLHIGREHSRAELWCSKTHGLIYTYPCEPKEAQAQAELLASLDPALHDALRAWIETGMEITDENGLPDLDVLHTVYQGEFDDMQDFAQWYAANTGFLDGIPIEVTRYFNWDLYANDLEKQFITAEVEDRLAIHVYAEN